MRFSQAYGIYRPDVAVRYSLGRRPPPVGRVRSQAKGRDGRSTPCPSVAMSSTGYSSSGLLASIARLRFTGRTSINLLPDGRKGFIIER